MTLGIIGEKFLHSLPPCRLGDCGSHCMQHWLWQKIAVWLDSFGADTYKIKVSICVLLWCVFFLIFFFKKWSKRHVLKQQIMCDYDDSLFTRGRLESHLASSSEWDRLTSGGNELDSMKRTTTFSNSLLNIGGDGGTVLQRFIRLTRKSHEGAGKFSPRTQTLFK